MHFQLQQFFTLLLLVVLGKFTGYMYLSWSDIVLVLIVTTVISHLFIYFTYKKVNFFSFSALSTAIGVMLMMATQHLWILFALIVLGLGQKYLFKCRDKHLFNPSNFALIMGLLLFYTQAHIVLGQLGEERWLQVVVILLASAILLRVERWLIPLVFTSSYLILEYFIVVSSDPLFIFEMLLQRFYSVSFLLFIVFMLTDPMTTPTTWRRQLIFAIFIALIATLLDYYVGFRVQHLFLSLFFNTFVFILFECYQNDSVSSKDRVKLFTLLVLVLSAIIYIEFQVPYYLNMY